MHAAVELLEKYGLVRDTDSLRVAEIAKRKIVRLQEELFSTVVPLQREDYGADLGVDREMDPFTFLASKSMRGETSCGEYGCRVEKLDMLGRYAALYANRIIIPLPLTTLRPWMAPKRPLRRFPRLARLAPSSTTLRRRHSLRGD